MNTAHLLPIVLLIGIVGCSGGGGQEPEPDTGSDSEDTTAADVAEDTEEDSGSDVPDADDAESDADDDATDDTADATPDVVVLECETLSRQVGDECVSEYDRRCTQTSECREDEECVFGEDEDGFGRCIYELIDPIVCPGGPDCPDVEDAPLRAGFAAIDISPSGWELPRAEFLDDNGWEFEGDVRDPTTFCDCGRDMTCPPEDEYADCWSNGEWSAPDADGSEGDGYMQGGWIAGFNFSRVALPCPDELMPPACEGVECCHSRLVHDPVWARVAVIEQGESRIAIVAVDTVGWFYSDVLRARAWVDDSLEIDWLLIAATHNHQTLDTFGIYGPGVAGSDLPDISGVDSAWMEETYAHIAEGVAEAVAGLEDVDVYASNVDTGYEGLPMRDSRDPYIFDDRITTVHFVREGTTPGDADATLGTIINWHMHPEVLWGSNTLISSDFPHYVREYVESGLPEDAEGDSSAPEVPGLGGVAVYISGAVGGLLFPGEHTEVVDRVGRVETGEDHHRASALGERLAEMILEAAPSAERMEESLWFTTDELFLPIQNRQLQTGQFGLNLFARELYNWRLIDGLLGPRYPLLLSAVTQIRLGSIAFQTMPGEPFPELFVGGYDPDDSVSNPIIGDPFDLRCAEDLLPPEDGEPDGFPCMISPGNENPPDLSAPSAREGHLRERLPGDYEVIVGLGNDALGYLVPPYDFQTGLIPYYQEAEGDHYEETNAVGDVVDLILDVIDEQLARGQ